MANEMQQPPANESAQEYIRVDRENYARWIDAMVNQVRTINPALPAANEPALRMVFETILNRGYRTLNGPIQVYGYGSRELPYEERFTLERFSRMSVEELQQAAKDIPDRLKEPNRKLFNDLAEQRSAADRWDALFPEGANQVRMPLVAGGGGQSIDDRIAETIARHNDRVAENIASARAEAESIADPTERERALSRVGRDISQRQIRRAPPIPTKKDPSKMEPPKLEELNPKTNQWELGQKLGSFLEQNHEWALLDDFTIENGRTTTSNNEGSSKEITPLDFITNNLPDTDGIDPKRLSIVISRDPQLIGEMSSGQCWRSCMIEDGINFSYVQEDIRKGTLIAYVVGAEDTAARYPLMRVLLKPFDSSNGETILVPSKIYGAAANSSRTQAVLLDALTEFSRIQNGSQSGEFEMRSGLYADGQATTVVLGAEWTPQATRNALDGYQRGALQEYTTEWQGRLDRIRSHDGPPEALESLKREVKTLRNRIARLGEPDELARSFFREARRTSLGTMPTPEMLLDIAKDSVFIERLQALTPLYNTENLDSPGHTRTAFPWQRDFMNTASTWANDPNASTWLDLAAHYHPLRVLEYGEAIADKPYAAETIESIARANPSAAIAHSEQLVNHPRYHDIISNAAYLEPTNFLKKSASYKTHPDYFTLIEEAGRLKPADFFENLPNYLDHPHLRERIGEAAAKDAFAALKHANNFINQPYAETILRSSAAEDPDAAIEFGSFFAKQPFGEEIIRAAAAQADPSQVLIHSKQYMPTYPDDMNDKYTRFAEELISNPARADPVSGLRHARNYARQPFAEKLIRELAQKDPLAAVRFSDGYIAREYGPDILREAVLNLAEHNPAGLLHNADKFFAEPYAVAAIEKASRAAPETAKYIAWDLAEYERQRVMRDNARINPSAAIRNIARGPYYVETLQIALSSSVSYDARKLFWEHVVDVDPNTPELPDAFAERFISSIIRNEPIDPLAFSQIVLAEPQRTSDLSSRLYDVHQHLSQLHDKPYYGSIINLMAEYKPDDFIWLLPEVIDKFPNAAQVRETSLRAYVKENPSHILTLPNAAHYASLPAINEITRNALLRLVETDPERILSKYSLGEPHLVPFADEIRPLVAKRLLETDPAQLFHQRYSINDDPWGSSLIEQAARLAPQAVFAETLKSFAPTDNGRSRSEINYYKKALKPYIEIAAQSDPLAAMDFARQNIRNPLAVTAFAESVSQRARNVVSRILETPVTNSSGASIPPDAGLSGVAFEEMVKDNTVWRLRNPQTGEGFYIKRANADEIAMTTRAANFTLPTDSPIILPKIAGTLEDLPLAIRSHLKNLPADAHDIARGATNFLITREVPFDAGIMYPSFALRGDHVIKALADASLAALKGKPITATEYDGFVDGVTRLNEAGIFHGDMLSNVSIQRGADGRMQFHIIDFDPWDPNIGKNPLLDVDHVNSARAHLENVGAVETSTRSNEPTRFELYQRGLIGKTHTYSLHVGESLGAALRSAQRIAIETGSQVKFDMAAAGFSNTSPVMVTSQGSMPALHNELLAREGWLMDANGRQVRLPISNLPLAQETLQSMTLQGPSIHIEMIEGKPHFVSVDPKLVNAVSQFQDTQGTMARREQERQAKYDPYRTGPLSTAQANPLEQPTAPDTPQPVVANTKAASPKARLLGTTAMPAPIVGSDSMGGAVLLTRPIVTGEPALGLHIQRLPDAPLTHAPVGGGMLHTSAGSGTGVAMGLFFHAMRGMEGGSTDTARRVGGNQLAAEMDASHADIVGMAPDAAFLTTAGMARVAPKVAPGLAPALEGLVANGARALGPVSLLAGAGVTYAEMRAAQAAQDGRREAGALYGLLGGMAGGAGTGAAYGFVGGGPWGSLIAGGVGAVGGGFLASEYGRRSQMGDQMQRDLDQRAQIAVDASVDRLRELRNIQLRGEAFNNDEIRDIKAIHDAMLEQHTRLEVLQVPETDIDGQLRRDFQLNQTAKAISFLEIPNANLFDLPRTSRQAGQAASARLPELVAQLNARYGELHWKQWLDQDRFGKKDGIVTVAEVVKAVNEYGLDLYTLAKNGKGLTLDDLLGALHAVGVDSDGVRNGRSFTPNKAPLIADSVHSSFTGRPGALHLLETLEALHIPGMNGQQLRGIMDQYGISVAMLDLKGEGKITEGDVARAFITNGVPREMLNGLLDDVIKASPPPLDGETRWPTTNRYLGQLRDLMDGLNHDRGKDPALDLQRWENARDIAQRYLVEGGSRADATFEFNRMGISIPALESLAANGLLPGMDANSDGILDMNEAREFVSQNKLQFKDSNGNSLIDMEEFLAGLPSEIKARVQKEQARLKALSTSGTDLATPPAEEEIVVTASQLSPTEKAALARSVPAVLAKQLKKAKLFDVADTDSDKTVSFSELRTIMRDAGITDAAEKLKNPDTYQNGLPPELLKQIQLEIQGRTK